MPGPLHYILCTSDCKLVYNRAGKLDKDPFKAKPFKTIGSAKKWAREMKLEDWQVFESTFGREPSRELEE